MKKIAVILSGCGNRDGSELQETLSLLLAIDRRGWTYQCFAPQGKFSVVSHVDPANHAEEQRDIFAESARIARGNILPLGEYRPSDFDALALPGGMGAARNLSTYAFDGAEMTVRQDVANAILQTYEARKPIAAMCIAPMVLACVLGRKAPGLRLTLGHPGPAAEAAEAMGATHIVRQATEVCVDRDNKILTTPAYMVASRISEIFQGAENMVAELQTIIPDSSSH